jgi:hypothetical protein
MALMPAGAVMTIMTLMPVRAIKKAGRKKVKKGYVMAYNRENLLKRIVAVQDIVKEHKKHDTPQKKIYEKHIKDIFHISYSCFNEWIGTPSPRMQLQKLQEKKEKKKEIEKMQGKLF